jgi:hypothetical protein
MRVRAMEVQIERRLQTPAAATPRGPRVRPWMPMAVAALAAAAAVALWVGRGQVAQRTSSAVASVERVSGAVRAAGGRVAIGPIAPSASIELGADGDLTLAVGRAAAVHVVGPAVLGVVASAQDTSVRLTGGRLDATVGKRLPGETFAVELGHGRVEVRGTRFSVGYAGEGSWVRVDEGLVAVIRPGVSDHPVSAGETFWLAPEHVRSAAVAPPAVPEQPTPPEQPAANACAAARSQCRSLAPAVRSAMRTGDHARALRLVGDVPRVSASCPSEVRDCVDEIGYLRAEALRLAGRLEAAVGAFRALDRAAAPAEMRQNALYAAAELEQRLGRSRAAIRDFEHAAAVAPAGPIREEALLGAMDAAAGAEDPALASEMARRYLAAYPQGRGVARAARLASQPRK